jgi:lysophospholipase L1-like esterase
MKKAANYLLLVSSIIIMLFLSEIGFRFAAYKTDLNNLETIEEVSTTPRTGEKVRLGRIIRLSKNPRIIYELIPNLSVIYTYYRAKRNAPLTTNADGFRGKSVPINKNLQSRRIVGIGDSLMFGWGVKDEETYLSILAELLNAHYPEITWEIINMAVPGYNTVMEVETLKEKGLQYKPDIVLIHYFWNDLRLPNFIREQEDYFALNQSFIVKYFRRNVQTIKLIRSPRHSSGINYEGNPEKVPEQYRDMVGIKAYYRAMEELKTLSIKHTFDVVVLAYGPSANVKNICLQLGFHMLDLIPLWQKYTSEQGILDTEAAWRLHENDTHPSVSAHKFIAKTLSTMLVELSGKNCKP